MSESEIQTKWPWVKLADYARIVSGATPKTSESKYWDGDINWVTPKDVSDLDGYPFLDSTPRTLTSEGLASCSAEVLPPFSVLLSSRAPIGLVAINRIPVATNQGFKSFVPDASRLDAVFLFHWLQANRSLLENLGTGATFKEVSKTVMTRVEIPLPPLNDQKRIAAVLDKADALRRHRQKSIQLTERLIQSVFIDMFGDPATNPNGLPMLELGRFGIVQTGNTPPRINKANYAEAGLEWVKTDNIVEDMVVVTPSRERLSDAGAKVARIAPAGSLLVACIAGSEKSIGRAALIDREVAFNQQINAITPHADTSSLFLYFLLKIARRQIQRAAAKGMKKMINKSTFEGLRFIAPAYDDQLKFERVAERLVEQSKDCQTQLFQLGTLFSSLQQRAFRGELDLSRLFLEEDVEAIERAAGRLHRLVHETLPKTLGINHANRAFVAPSEIELTLRLQDATVQKGSPIPWSSDYFTYRILAAQPAPFSFADLMQKAEAIFEEPPPYETIRDLIFDLLGQDGKPAFLRQRFDLQTNEVTNEVTGRKEIVFEPVP